MRRSDTEKYYARTHAWIAFFLLGSLLPTALSLEMQSRLIGSSGTITYSASATLLVTDSTLGGPVPYEIDENPGYQTGSTYTLPPGTHTIELPSPYTSPNSNVTYYFSYWQDGATDNPTTVTLEPDAIVTLHGTYSTSPEHPPPPPPPPSDYVGYSGFEGTTQGPDGFYYVTVGGYSGSVTSFYDSGSIQFPSGTVLPYAGSYMLEFGTTITSGHRQAMNTKVSDWCTLAPDNTIYISQWLYYPSWVSLDNGGSSNWDEMIALRNWVPGGQSGEHNIEFMLCQNAPWSEGDWYWDISYSASPMVPISGGYRYYVYGNSAPVEVWSSTGTVSWEKFQATPTGGVIPLGRWFRLELCIYRHLTEGMIQLWITDPYNPNPQMRDCKLLFGIENARTYSSGCFDIDFSIIKWYSGNVFDTLVLLADEFYVSNYNAHEG